MLALTPATFASQSGNRLPIALSPADNISVTGKIVDASGEPLPGASVYVKGTTNGTISDIDGNFTLNAPDDAILVFTFVGYISQEIAVNGRTNIGTITMQEDNQEIEQVVVIGYGTQKKVDLTGSVAIVDADEMKKVSNSNISTMLEGKVAGVQITSDGQPGADPNVRIRGIGSFGSTPPLYVIDGVPVGTTIRDFSPNDIATIQILKDASAAAIYGSRAANGVVIITTKNGKKNQPARVDYSGYFGIDKITNNIYEVMDADQFSQYMGSAKERSEATSNPSELGAGYVKGSDGVYKWYDETNTNWFDEVFKTGIRQNHNVNISGGGDAHTYNVGLDYFNQKGTVEGAGPDYQRYTVRVNNTFDVKFIKFRTGIVYSHSDQNTMSRGNDNGNTYIQGIPETGPILRQAFTMQPTIKAYDESTWCLDATVPAAADYKYDSYGFGRVDVDKHGDLRGFVNPLLVNNLWERNTKVDRVVATANASVDIFNMLKLNPANHKLSYNLNLSYSKTYAKDHTWMASYFYTPNDKVDKSNEQLTKATRQYDDALVENTINYEGTLAEKHHINVVAGITYENEYTQNFSEWGKNFPEPYYLQINNAEDRDANSSEYQHVIESYIGRLNYDFDQRYLLSVTARRDGSSRLSKEDRWGWFPSVSLGWRLDREAFFPVDEHLINLLKIRGSYGILGNENIGEYAYMATMARQNQAYSFNNTKVLGSSVTTFVNTAIAWEKKKSTSVGFDLGMFSNQLEFTFEWYKNVSEDLLYGVAVPANGGFSNANVTMNAASMENSGFEWSASYHNYKHKVKYDINFNVSTLKNEVTALSAGKDRQVDGRNITTVGEEIGKFYGWEYGGIIRSQAELDELNAKAIAQGKDEYQPGANIGDCWYVDQNGDGVIDADDQKVLGSGLPKINFGLSGRVEYKGFDLAVSTFGALKYKVIDDIYDLNLMSCYGYGNRSPEMLNSNQFDANGNYISEQPACYLKNSATLGWNDLFSERKIQKANYWKIATVELGYNFKDEWFNGILTGVRAYVSGQNLATITKYKGYNVDFAPGTFTPGYNYCSYPTPKTVMFGLRASF